MGPEAILLSVRDDGREGSYRFTCPGCADDVEKRADRKIVALWSPPASTSRSRTATASQAAMLFDDARRRTVDPRRAPRSRSTT